MAMANKRYAEIHVLNVNRDKRTKIRRFISKKMKFAVAC